jgi:hypothetical protein
MAISPDHGKLDPALQGIHVPYQFSYANNAARTGAGGFVSTDVGKFARQTDNNTIWMLTATTPTWVLVGFQTDATRVIRTTNQSINNNSVTAISFDTETYDEGRGLWVIGSPTRITAVIAGIYAFSGVLRYDANSTGERAILVRVNGATLVASGGEGNPSATNDSRCDVAGAINLAASDYLELCAYQNSGGALNAQAQASYANWFEVRLVRPT